MSDCKAVAMPISQTKMNFEGCSWANGVKRPVTLLLDQGFNREGLGSSCISGANNGIAGARKKKRCRASDAKVKKFADIYETTGESLGEGSFGQVTTYRNISTKQEFAVKVIKKTETKSRHRVLKEIEIFHHCQGHQNILQMIEYFEEDDKFYLVFEKMEGGTLLDNILRRGHLSEQEASRVVRDIASGLNFLHKKGIAHRDLKPENILCVKAGQLTPVKICDFDLGSGIQIGSRHCSPVTTPELLSPVGSADFMAPEVVDVWQYQAESYDKRCDLWSLGTILYILLCGYRPFYAHCDRECRFDEGGDCEDCQELLFKCIQQGVYSFPDPDWAGISEDAKDLIQHLLVKNPYQRYTADQVLRHPWLTKDLSAAAPLATPFILSRNNSVRELGMFAEMNAVNRLIQRHISINEFSTVTTPSLLYSKRSNDDTDVDSYSQSFHSSDRLIADRASNRLTADRASDRLSGRLSNHLTADRLSDHPTADRVLDSVTPLTVMFQLSRLEDDLEVDGCLGRLSEEEDEEQGIRPMGWDFDEGLSDSGTEDELNDSGSVWFLSKPGGSRLARRRAFRVQQFSECSVDSGNASSSSSPPDYFPDAA
jgi:MAP kinase interacting serine/threonine kinase